MTREIGDGYYIIIEGRYDVAEDKLQLRWLQSAETVQSINQSGIFKVT